MTASGWVKSTTTSASVKAPRRVVHVDAGDELQIVRRLDGPAQLRTHRPRAPSTPTLIT